MESVSSAKNLVKRAANSVLRADDLVSKLFDHLESSLDDLVIAQEHLDGRSTDLALNLLSRSKSNLARALEIADKIKSKIESAIADISKITEKAK